jgi:hypothetical protein
VVHGVETCPLSKISIVLRMYCKRQRKTPVISEEQEDVLDCNQVFFWGGGVLSVPQLQSVLYSQCAI